MPPVPDLGLDAVQVRPDGEILFSIREGAFSQQLGTMLGPGDMLSNRGQRVRSAQDLIAAFQPTDPEVDPGLDALYVWPSGEVWFSTETGFDTQSGVVGPGDLLSDQGYVVFRNLDLVQPFGPLEDLADFGLDALWIVSDSSVAPGPPTLTSISLTTHPPGLVIRGAGSGSAFQLEKAVDPAGPYLPLSPIGPDNAWVDALESGGQVRRFYRAVQW
jgi:hypothetical protein